MWPSGTGHRLQQLHRQVAGTPAPRRRSSAIRPWPGDARAPSSRRAPGLHTSVWLNWVAIVTGRGRRLERHLLVDVRVDGDSESGRTACSRRARPRAPRRCRVAAGAGLLVSMTTVCFTPPASSRRPGADHVARAPGGTAARRDGPLGPSGRTAAGCARSRCEADDVGGEGQRPGNRRQRDDDSWMSPGDCGGRDGRVSTERARSCLQSTLAPDGRHRCSSAARRHGPSRMACALDHDIERARAIRRRRCWVASPMWPRTSIRRA